MEQRVDQALQQGVAAHKAGNLKEAEKLYRAILSTRQNHPDANHNLGVIAVSVGKVLEALPHFKKALEAKPNTEQFWISYIETLIKLGQLNHARQILQKGKTFGLRGEKIDLLKAKLSNKSGGISLAKVDANSPSKQQIDELIALYTNSTPQEALILAKKLIVQFPDDHLIPNILGAFCTALGKHNAAIKNFSKSIEINPCFVEAHNNLGNVFNELKRFDEAISSYKKAIELKPDYPEAYNNLGNTLNELGSHDEAIASYNKAIELKPDYPEAHNNLGKALNELGRHDVAIAVLNNAIKLKPKIAEVHNNLGIALNEIGKHTEATASYNNAIKLKPNYATAYSNLGVSLSYMKVKKYSNSLADNYLGILNSENIARPSDLINSIFVLLKHNEAIKESIRNYHSLTLSSVAFEICNRLSAIPLFMKIMEICPIPDLEIEGLLTELRKLLLLKSANVPTKSKLVPFQSALALQCFTNEYIYKETETEKAAIKLLEESLQKAYFSNGELEPYDIACLASYRPLFDYAWSATVPPPRDLEVLFQRQVIEPSQETLLKKIMPRLKAIKDETSLAVQAQYEENPYPRWINTRLEVNSMKPAEFVTKMKLQIKKNINSLSDTPKILIAGCGTGQHALETASRFKDSRVTAIDLSLSSLAYARRKTEELGIKNINYLQADILDLWMLDNKFDIVESAGVLHHMATPIFGWKALADCLKPAGLMKIGLYSELARQHIIKARSMIAADNILSHREDMIQFRHKIIKYNDPKLNMLLRSGDFYTTSTFRDLLFHVQEHRFTLPQISKMLDRLGLSFMGFETKNQSIIRGFEAIFPEPSAKYNLEKWHEYELSRPELFLGMYQFWCQKVN